MAFDNGITHFDLANNYGPPPGSAEENFGRILKKDFNGYRDEMIISTKAGYTMWNGPYGDWGSKKYLMASLDQSLKRMGVDYVDIFYHHRPDPDTPLQETMMALDLMVRQGKALYVGISNYPADEAMEAIEVLRHLGTPCLIHQPKYSMFERTVEDGLLDVLEQERVGCIAFSPLAQGLLTNKYLKGVPNDSRAAKSHGFLKTSEVSKDKLSIIRNLDQLAQKRGQSLAQMALAWVLKDPRITSALIGVSRPEQLADSLKCLDKPGFSDNELALIENILMGNSLPEERAPQQQQQQKGNNGNRNERGPKPQAPAPAKVAVAGDNGISQPQQQAAAEHEEEITTPVAPKPQKKKSRKPKKKAPGKTMAEASPAENGNAETVNAETVQGALPEVAVKADNAREEERRPGPIAENSTADARAEASADTTSTETGEAPKPAKPSKKRYYKKKKV
jgi:L-glyceraldehyde 3-phosphate reductase